MNAMRAHHSILRQDNPLARAKERLSTGRRINRAADDVAGLGIAQRMQNQIRGLRVSIKNSEMLIDHANIQDGKLNGIHSMFERIREITHMASNDTNTAQDRENMLIEVKQLFEEISSTSLGIDLSFKSSFSLDGTSHLTGSFTLSSSDGTSIDIDLSLSEQNLRNLTASNFINMFRKALENSEEEISGQILSSLLDNIDDSINQVSRQRAGIGAIINRLHHRINVFEEKLLNTQKAKSRILDADMAEEMIVKTRASVIQQAAFYVLAQSNRSHQNIIHLVNDSQN
jgi:flagellin